MELVRKLQHIPTFHWPGHQLLWLRLLSPKSVHSDAKVVSQIKTRLHSSTFPPIHRSFFILSFDTLQLEPLRAWLNEQQNKYVERRMHTIYPEETHGCVETGNSLKAKLIQQADEDLPLNWSKLVEFNNKWTLTTSRWTLQHLRRSFRYSAMNHCCVQ
jgi:hypothetical protein